MDSEAEALSPCERRLYSVFKSFDERGEEALERGAVLALCDALQLEARGAALADALLGRGAQRVTFAQFRSGLLAVLGATPPAPAPPAPAPSDDDSSGREVAPKFVVGSKKYGRRSRPPRAASAPGDGSPPPDARRGRCKRSASAMEPAEHALGHDSGVDCEAAFALCRQLHMDGIERRIVERVFEATPARELTVGEFFDRLDVELSTSLAASCDALPAELVVEAWERAGVQQPRRLLVELGFAGAALRAPDLERVLDDELAALPAGAGVGAVPTDANALLLLAALALSRLREHRARRRADAAVDERDRLRADVAEAGRRAQLLAQEVDESQARLEAELAASLRRAEARHTEGARIAEEERAAERERAAAEHMRLEAEVARRAEVEARLRGEAAALQARVDELEGRAAAAEQRVSQAERERASLAVELRVARAELAPHVGGAEAETGELSARLAELRHENERLRDRCDELCSELEARARVGAASAAVQRADGASWRDEAAQEPGSAPASPDSTPGPEAGAECAGQPDAADKLQLAGLVKELEAGLELMRQEYDTCEEYWSAKLREERALHADELRAGDERLAELAARVAEYERQFAPGRRAARACAAPAPALPAIAEAHSLELQFAELERELAAGRLEARAALAARDDELARLRARAAALEAAGARASRLAGALGAARAADSREATALRARLARADAAVARLTARLAAADLLVKELYVENCLLGPPPRAL